MKIIIEILGGAIGEIHVDPTPGRIKVGILDWDSIKSGGDKAIDLYDPDSETSHNFKNVLKAMSREGIDVSEFLS